MVVLFLLLPACSTLSPQQRSHARTFVQQEYEAGHLSAARRDAILQAIDADEPVDWEGLGIVGVNALLALIGGPLIVRAQRGKPRPKAPQASI